MKQALIAISRLEFIIMMSVIVAVDALAIDSILPALSAISEELAITRDNDRQFIITSLFAGYAIGVLVYGIASDSFGRKPPIYVGFVIFLIGTLITIFASSFTMLLIGRALQGLGAAGPQIIPSAITRDIYKGRSMAHILSLVMMVFMLVPAVAPLIGQGILLISNWQGIFVMLGIYSLLALVWFSVRLPETLAVEKRVPFSLKQAKKSILATLKNKQAVKYMLAEGLTFGALLAFLSTAQQVFQELYLLGDKFAIYFGSLAFVMMFASFVNAKLVEKMGMRKLILIGSCTLFIVSISYLFISQLAQLTISLWFFLLFSAISYFCLGILFGNMHALAMENVGHIAGVAASLIGSISTIISIITAAIIGYYYNDSVTPIIAGFAVLMVPVIAIIYYDQDKQALV